MFILAAPVLLLFLSIQSLASQVEDSWIITCGGEEDDYGESIESTDDGGYIITGSTIVTSENGKEAVYLVKTDSLGNIEWSRNYPGDEKLGTSGYCVIQNSYGNYVVAGKKDSKVAMLLETDSKGNLEWMQIFEDAKCIYDLLETPEGGYILVGNSKRDTPRKNRDLWLSKTDGRGNPLWTREYGDIFFSNEMGYSIELTLDGSYILTGFGGPKPPQRRGSKVWLLKIDRNGDTLWTRYYDRGDSIPSCKGCCVEATSDSGFVICGVTGFRFKGEGALWLIKTNSLGEIQWEKVYDWGEFGEVGKSVKQTLDGGFIITGAKNYNTKGQHDVWLLRTDSLGDTLWTRTYGNQGLDSSDEGRSVLLSPDGGFVIAGFTYNERTKKDVLLIKTDSLGHIPNNSTIAGFLPSLIFSHQVADYALTISYTQRISGFNAKVFDVLGNKIDDIHCETPSGSLSWGKDFDSGVYFICETYQNYSGLNKVVLSR